MPPALMPPPPADDAVGGGAPATKGVPGASICGTLTAYVPPPRSAVMTVPGATPGPVRGMPTASAPDVTLATVSVVPAM